MNLRLMMSAVVGAATVLLMCGIAKSESAVAHKPPKSTSQQTGYFVEFRVALIGTYGHSYVAYGRTGQAINYADLHPMGGYAVMALGHVLPVPANTEWDAKVLGLPVATKYRRALTAQQYQKLVHAVWQARANKKPYWNAITNNCNHFVGQLALAIGLEVPSEFQVSYMFVPALRDLNEKKARSSKN